MNSISKNIRIARDHVTLVGYGQGQWGVNRWSPKHNMTWQGNITNWYRAAAEAKESRIRVALELSGVEEAGEIANTLAMEEGRWDKLVRHELRTREYRNG